MTPKLKAFSAACNSDTIGTALEIERKVTLFSALYEAEYKVLIRILMK